MGNAFGSDRYKINRLFHIYDNRYALILLKYVLSQVSEAFVNQVRWTIDLILVFKANRLAKMFCGYSIRWSGKHWVTILSAIFQPLVRSFECCHSQNETSSSSVLSRNCCCKERTQRRSIEESNFSPVKSGVQRNSRKKEMDQYKRMINNDDTWAWMHMKRTLCRLSMHRYVDA